MNIKQEIGQRLRQFGLTKFKSMSEFARALGMSQQNLNGYLSGNRLPGNKMEERLRLLGCDIILLEHGIEKKELNERFSAMVDRISQQEITKDEMEIIAILRTLGITNTIDFNVYFDYSRAVQDKASKGKPLEYKKVAEPSPSKYKSSKKGRIK
jgi:transcriptional regulator with XRE-family HTH domain